MTAHVVNFSGGAASFCAAKRVIERHGPSSVTLLFADTLIEDEDTYRFLREGAEALLGPLSHEIGEAPTQRPGSYHRIGVAQSGGRLVMIAEGRTPFDVFRDKRFLGNSRVDPCSRILKRELLDEYTEKHFDIKDTVLYVGIDWTEEHRYHRLKERKAPWRVEAPLLSAPFLTKKDMLRLVEELGIKQQRLYLAGAPHANCGGRCIKAGKAHFAWLLRSFPDRYEEWERQEQELRAFLDKDVSVLRDRFSAGGEESSKPLTLAAFRQRIEGGAQLSLEERFEWGGCGCFSDVG